jgi:hypothetical protein
MTAANAAAVILRTSRFLSSLSQLQIGFIAPRTSRPPARFPGATMTTKAWKSKRVGPRPFPETHVALRDTLPVNTAPLR